MMANNEPMSELRLEQMRGYATAIRTTKHAIEAVSSELVHASDYILAVGDGGRDNGRTEAGQGYVCAMCHPTVARQWGKGGR